MPSTATIQGNHADTDVASTKWREGDRAAALEKAFVDSGPVMLAIARRIAGDDAPDIVQEALLRLWSHPHRFDHTRGTLGAYLVVVTRSAALDHVRQVESQRQRERRGQHYSELHCEREPIDAELRSQLAAALDKLGDNQRCLMNGAFVEHTTYRQIAANLGLPEGTVKSQIRRTLTQLRNNIRLPVDVD